MSKQNRRVQRTRGSLHDALLQLITAKSYDQITIQDITNQAELSRATFYLHYNDKDALFAECIDELLDELIGRFAEWTDNSTLISGLPATIIFQLIAENHDLYKILFTEPSSAALVPRVRQHLAQGLNIWIRNILGEDIEENLHVSLDMISYYTANSMIGLIAWWLENGMPYDVETIGELGKRLNMFGIMPFIMGGHLEQPANLTP